VRDMPSLILGGGMSVAFLLAWLGGI
jgi:hypothetical protein